MSEKLNYATLANKRQKQKQKKIRQKMQLTRHINTKAKKYFF